jgi:thiol-disulfide isomerase/thioredoxin
MNSYLFAKKLIVIMASLVILAGSYAKAVAAPAPSLALEQKQLGDLDLRTPSGEQVSLFQYMTRKTIVVVFWAAWCPICRGEAPTINKINTNPNVKVIAVNEGDSPGRIKDFIAANKVGYQVVLDPVSDLAKAFGVPGMPYCVIIGRSGFVVYRGYLLPEDLDSYII